MGDLRFGGAAAEQPTPASAEIAGFWSRIGALLIDAALLACLGAAIGTLAFRQMVALGQEGRLIGAAITLVYFGILNSRWGGGATLGKRLLGLKVIARDGRKIALARSLLRTIVLWTPYYLNGLVFRSTSPAADIALEVLVALAVFGVGGFIVFLYLFNRRTRQALHDLLAGSFVVRAGRAEAGVTAHLWKGSLAFAALAAALVPAILVTLALYAFHTQLSGLMKQLTAVQSAVLAYPGADTAQVTANTTWFTSTTGLQTTHTILVVAVRMRNVPASMEAAGDDIAGIVLKTAPGILGQQALQVRIAYGYDLGIFAWTITSGFSGTTLDWTRRIRARQTGESA